MLVLITSSPLIGFIVVLGTLFTLIFLLLLLLLIIIIIHLLLTLLFSRRGPVLGGSRCDICVRARMC